MKKQHTKMDILVLAVVLMLFVGAFIKARMVRNQPETVHFTYQMTLTRADGNIVPGDTALCMAGKQSVGTLVELKTEGTQLVLILQAEGFPIDGGYRTNVYDILPGFEYDFYTDSASWYGIVTGIS